MAGEMRGLGGRERFGYASFSPSVKLQLFLLEWLGVCCPQIEKVKIRALKYGIRFSVNFAMIKFTLYHLQI